MILGVSGVSGVSVQPPPVRVRVCAYTHACARPRVHRLNRYTRYTRYTALLALCGCSERGGEGDT